MPQTKHSRKSGLQSRTWRSRASSASRSADRRGRLDVEERRPRLGDERVTVEEADGAVVALDRERSVERRRKAKGDLDLVGVHERREPPARVASVRRGERASEAVREHDLHRCEHTS